MAYAILRIAKLKTFGRINAAANHNLRLKTCLNADPAKRALNINLVDKGSNLVQAVKARLTEAGIRKWRKDAVLASEIMLTASPEFFEKGASTEAWITANQQWLTETFGENVVSAVVHRDETTPHIHCILVPIKDGKLSHKNLFGGARDALVQWQTDYAKCMEGFGLERGVSGSQAKHEKIRQFYAAVNATPENVLKGMPARPGLEQVAETIGVFKKERVIPVSKALGLIRTYRAQLTTYITSIVGPLHVQMDRLRRQIKQRDEALRASRLQNREAEILLFECQEELKQSRRSTDRMASFLKIAERLVPDLVAKVNTERERIAREVLATESRSAGVKGAKPLWGTHSTLLPQRVGSFGLTGQSKLPKLKLM
jgi:hypothetical protein